MNQLINISGISAVITIVIGLIAYYNINNKIFEKLYVLTLVGAMFTLLSTLFIILELILNVIEKIFIIG